MEQVLEKELSRENSAILNVDEEFFLQRDADVVLQIERVLNWLQQNQIVVPQPDEIRDYLLNYPDIIDVISLFCKKVRECFAISAQLSLELYRDPEIEYVYLTLYIRQQNFDADILDKIDKISAELDKVIAGKSGWLIITTDLCPPR